MKKIITLITALALVGSVFTGCSSKESSKNNDEKKTAETTSAATVESVASDAGKSAEENQNTKYGNAEVYTNDEGKKAAKTESGVEIELSTDKLAELYGEYQKVQGSGSDAERELLDQIQLILEASGSVSQVQ